MDTKEPKYVVVEPNDPAQLLMDSVIRKSHLDLLEANVALVWENNVKPDKDGLLTWGHARKVGPLDHIFSGNDFVICLTRKVWDELDDKSKAALIDHELSHCGVSYDDEGEPKFYVKKHDLEEFTPIIERHGMWRKSIEAVVNAALAKKDKPEKASADPTLPEDMPEEANV